MAPRKPFPLIPTLMVLVAVPVLIGFGIWQLQRAQWKEALLADLAANAQRPVAELGTGPVPDGYQFRRVTLFITCPPAKPDVRVGHNRDGQVGYSQFLSCRAGSQPLLVNAGWAIRPDGWSGAPDGWPSAPVAGMIIETADKDPPYTLVLAQAAPGLVPSAPPAPGSIRNTHRSYAVQWFGFAVILAAVYTLYLRRWRREGGTHLASDRGQG